MKISPKALDVALAAVKPATSKRSAIQALTGVRIHNDGGAFLEATDMEVAVEKRLDVIDVGAPLDVIATHADVAKAAKLYGKREMVELSVDFSEHDHNAVSGARTKAKEQWRGAPAGFAVAAYLKKLEDYVPREELIVSDGKRTIRFPGLRHEDWPNIDWNPSHEQTLLTAKGSELSSVIKRTEPIASRDETRPILTGLCLDMQDGMLVATDSYRLLVRKLPGTPVLNDDQKFNVVGPLMRHVAKSAAKIDEDITVSFAPRTHTMTHDDGSKEEVVSPNEGEVLVDIPAAGEVWRGRIISGQFPNYRQLIPESYELTVTMAKKVLEEGTNVACAFLQKNAPARLSVNGKVTLSGYTPDGPSFEEELEGATHTGVDVWDGNPFDIGFNPDFMRDVAKLTASDDVEIKLISPLRPGAFMDGEDMHLLMPIRLNV